MTQLVQSYSHLHPSAVRGPTAGFLTAPTSASAAAATALPAVADVAAARSYRSNAGASLDPVVTADGDRPRFEFFSGCCGVYARLDSDDDTRAEAVGDPARSEAAR